MGKHWVPFAAAGGALVAGAVFVVAPVTAQTAGTISACINSSHQFTHVTTGTPMACPSQTPVSWPGNVPDSPSPSPSATSASPSPTATTASPSPSVTPSPSPTGKQCVLTSFSGSCGPYYYPANTASNGFNTYVGPDFFSPVTGETDTLTVTDPGHWDALADVRSGNTSVTGYPSNQQMSSGDGTSPLISSYTTLSSSFAENMNANSGTDAEAAYDVWAVGGLETMIQFDFTPLRPDCKAGGLPILATVAFTEPADGTVQNWNFCEFGTERIWQLAGGNEQSGSVDILAMLTWEQSNGYLPATARLDQIGFGFEICSTGGQPEDFQVTSYSLTGLPNP